LAAASTVAYGTTRLVTKEIERGNAAPGQNRRADRVYPYGAWERELPASVGSPPEVDRAVFSAIPVLRAARPVRIPAARISLRSLRAVVVAVAPLSPRLGCRRGSVVAVARRCPGLRRAPWFGQQPQEPPQQPPPPPPAGAAGAPPPRPVTATVDNSLTVSSWPCGQAAGAAAWLIGRLTSKVAPQARHRYS
jgi:hypothetical protein